MTDRTGECWHMAFDRLGANGGSELDEQFLVIVRSEQGKNYVLHTLICTHADGKFEFRKMREWSMTPLEHMTCKKVG